MTDAGTTKKPQDSERQAAVAAAGRIAVDGAGPAKAVVFVGVLYGLSLLLVGGYRLLGGTGEGVARFALSVAYMFVPLASAAVVQRLIYREAILPPLRARFRVNRWWLVAWLLPPALAAATLVVSLAFAQVSFSPAMEGLFTRYESFITPEQAEEVRNELRALPVHPVWLILVQALLAGATVNALAAFGEEAGWRGLLLTELLPLGFWRSSLAIGLVWGLWHAPLILMGHNYPDHPIEGVGMMMLFCVLLSPLLTLLTLRARSAVAAAIFHGTLNAIAVLPVALVDGGSDLTVGFTGFAGLSVLTGMNALIVIRTRSRGRSVSALGDRA